MNITLVTGNPNKLREAEMILGPLSSRAIDLPELQSMDLQTIVEAKLDAAYQAVGGPVMVEDIAVCFPWMGGFPGPFVKYWEKYVGYERALLLAQAENNFCMTVRCGLGCKLGGQKKIYVETEVAGTLVTRRGDVGWGFDFYFIPDGQIKTYAQMGVAAKCQISHRAQALQAMRELLA